MSVIPEKTAESPEVLSVAEPPCGDESNTCMAYQAQIIRDKYRLLSDSRFSSSTNVKMNIREIDSIAQMIGGVEVSVSLHTVPLRTRHREAYAIHVTAHISPIHDCIERGYSSITSEGKSVMERIDHWGTRLEFEGYATQKGDDSICVGSSKRSTMPQVIHSPSVDHKRKGLISTGSSSTDLIDSGDPGVIPSLTKHLQVSQPNDLFRNRRSAPIEHRQKSNIFGSSSSEEDGLTGRSRLSMPELSRRSVKSSNTKLPSFMQTPELRPIGPHVKVEYDKFCAKTKRGKFNRITDCLGALADKWEGYVEETKLPSLSELTVFSLRGFGTFATHLGTGVYGSELEITLKRQSLSSNPMIWSSRIKCPITNRVAKGSANISWGCDDTKFAEDSCLFVWDSPHGAKITPRVSPK